MSYICRDCKHSINKEKPINKCPECGSIYIIPEGYKVTKRHKNISVTFNERLVSLVVGFIAGLLTFFIWGIFILVNGGAGAAKASLGAFYSGIKLALISAVLFAIIGFIFGEQRLIKLLGIIWGTDKELNANVNKVELGIPQWLIISVLLLIIIGAYGYLFSHM